MTIWGCPCCSAIHFPLPGHVQNFHLNRFIMTGWSSEKLEMIDISQVESRFFVRMKGSYTESLAKVEEVFGTIDAKVVAEVGKEFGFITSKMKEEEYRAKAAQFDNIIGMIRVRF